MLATTIIFLSIRVQPIYVQYILVFEVWCIACIDNYFKLY